MKYMFRIKGYSRLCVFYGHVNLIKLKLNFRRLLYVRQAISKLISEYQINNVLFDRYKGRPDELLAFEYRRPIWKRLLENIISCWEASKCADEKWLSFLDRLSSLPSVSPLSFSSLSFSAKGSWPFCLVGIEVLNSILAFSNERDKELTNGRAIAANKKTIINPKEIVDLCLFIFWLAFTKQMYLEKITLKKKFTEIRQLFHF